MAETFKLQTVLDHRQRLENLAQQKLADSLRRESELQHQIAEQQACLIKLHQELAHRQQHGTTIDELQLYQRSIDSKRKQIRKLVEQAEQLHREVARNRRNLTEASQEKKLLENLKDKKEAERRYHENRLEMAELDDIALRLGKKSP